MTADLPPDPVEQAHKAGLSVVPGTADKQPRVQWKDWQTRRQTREEFDALGHGSVWGVLTGPLYGIAVLDFDAKDGGLETLAALGLEVTVETPGGAHVYVQHPGHYVKSNARAFPQYPGLDIRGDRGIAWFSGRSKKGVYTPRQWPPVPQVLDPALAEILFPHPQETGTPAARGIWAGQGKGDERALRYLERVCQDIIRALPGTSNAALNKGAYSIGGLVAGGQLDEVFAYETLLTAAVNRGAGTPEPVIRAAMASGSERPWVFEVDEDWVPAVAYKAFRGGQGAVPAPIPFPVDALPAPLDSFVNQGSVSVSCPPDYLGAGVLPVLGTAIGAHTKLRMTETWTEGTQLYVTLVGRPGARKSPAMSLLLRPVREAEAALFTRARALADEDPDAWAEVEAPRIIVDDATIEALVVLLERNPRGVLLAADELTGWVQGMGQYKGGLGRDRQHWLTIWSRGALRVDRKKSTSHFVPDPYVSVLGGIQPEPLEDLMHGRDDGLLPRILMAQGEHVTPRFRAGVVEPAVLDGYADLWHRLRDDGLVGETFEFDPAGLRAFEVWVNEHYDTLAKVPPELAGAWAKMDGQAGRIALIMARLLDQGSVTEDAVDRAVALVRYFQGQAALILQGSSSASPWEKLQVSRLKALTRYIADHPGATRAELMVHGPEWALDGRTMDRLLETLEATGVWNG